MKYLVLLFLPLLLFVSCMKDTSAYLPQDKEQVTVDEPNGGTNPEPDPEPTPDKLTPGLHTVTIDVTMPNQSVVKRRFKYYMPISLSLSKPISLLFEFHGNMSLGSDALEDVKDTHSLTSLAIKENIILVFPAGSDDTGSIGWQQEELEFPFVDAMLDFFKSKSPLYDINRVYSTGHSSGAIFSFVLAMERSEVFAAVAPRAGQIRLSTQNPSRAVPIRAFNGVDDPIVRHSAAVTNMINLANAVGGYFSSDMVYNEKEFFEVPNYCKYQVRTWSGAKADYQLYSLIGIEHNVSLYMVQSMIWDFLSVHTLDKVNDSIYLSFDPTSIVAEQAEQVEIEIKTNYDAVVTYDAPSDWSPVYQNGVLTLTAPRDFFNCQNRNGEIKIISTKGGESVTRSIAYKLNAPKVYYEVGDIYYNSNLEPEGVVYWVNPNNIKEAKVVSKKTFVSRFGVCDPNAAFITPDMEDGIGNTKIWVDRNYALGTDGTFTAENCSYMWADAYCNKSGWYLPAANEFLPIMDELETVNAVLKKIGGDLLVNEGHDRYPSSTVIKGTKNRAIVCYSFVNGMSNLSLKGSDTSFMSIIAVKKVTK